MSARQKLRRLDAGMSPQLIAAAAGLPQSPAAAVSSSGWHMCSSLPSTDGSLLFGGGRSRFVPPVHPPFPALTALLACYIQQSQHA